MLSLNKVHLLVIKNLTVFQKDLLDAELSLAFSWKYLLFDLLGYLIWFIFNLFS